MRAITAKNSILLHIGVKVFTKACVTATLVGICGLLPIMAHSTRSTHIRTGIDPIGEAKPAASAFPIPALAWDTRINTRWPSIHRAGWGGRRARRASRGEHVAQHLPPPTRPLPLEDDPVFNDADEAEDATSVFDLVGDGSWYILAHVPGWTGALLRGNALSVPSIVAVCCDFGCRVSPTSSWSTSKASRSPSCCIVTPTVSHWCRMMCNTIFASVSHALEVAHANQVCTSTSSRQRADQPSRPGESHRFRPGRANRLRSGYGAAGGRTIDFYAPGAMRQRTSTCAATNGRWRR